MQTSTAEQIRTTVRQAYGAIASLEGHAGCCGGTGCCDPRASSSTRRGYSDADLAAVPEGADLGLGCGNPQAIAALTPGERVLDLGGGGGFDAFLAARQVGPSGRVIGVDMTPEMIALARRNAARTGDDWSLEAGVGQVVASALIEARKPMVAQPLPEACCESTLLSACCVPHAKLACCGTASQPTSCECQPDSAVQR